MINVKAYGARGNGLTDDTKFVQAAINAAFNLPGGTVGFPAGRYRVTSTLSTPSNVAGAVKLQGMGRPQGLASGVSGDPTAQQGSVIVYDAPTGDLFAAVLSEANKRQYITIEGLAGFGSQGDGIDGHGLHFAATHPTSAVVVCLRDVLIADCKQHGIFFDGNVFESQLFNVRSSQNGDRGFKAAANGSCIPGEVRLVGVSCNSNAVGLEFGGGGHFSYHGLTATSNTYQGLIATGVKLEGLDLQLEANGDPQASLGLNQGQFHGVNLTETVGQTTGMQFAGSLSCAVYGLESNGLATTDIAFDNSCSKCSVIDPWALATINLGTGQGHVIRRGGVWATAQPHSVGVLTVAGGGSVTPDAQLHDVVRITINAPGTITINNPNGTGTTAADGQELTIEIINNSSGVIGHNWQAQYEFDGTAPSAPANGKRRRVRFLYDASRAKWSEITRSASDV